MRGLGARARERGQIIPMRGPAVAGGVSRLSLCALHRQRRNCEAMPMRGPAVAGGVSRLSLCALHRQRRKLRGYARTSGGGRSIVVVFMRVASTEEKTSRLCLCADQRWREEYRGCLYAHCIGKGGTARLCLCVYHRQRRERKEIDKLALRQSIWA